MALVFVGGTSLGFNGATTGNQTISLTSLAGGIASAPAQDDLVIVAYGVGVPNSTNASANVASGNASGSYAEMAGSPLSADDSIKVRLVVSSRIMGATPDTQITVANAGSSFAAGAVAVSVWRGADVSTPIDVTPTTATGINTAQPDPPAITPATPGAIIIVCAAGAHGDMTAAFASSDQSNLVQAMGNDTADVRTAIGSLTWPGAGSVNPAALTGGNAGTQGSWAALTLALRPAETVMEGNLSVTLDGATLAATVDLDIIGGLAVTLEGAGLSAVAQVGDGVVGELGDLSITLDDATLDATATLDVLGDMAVVLDDAGLVSVGLSGSNGPFARRPLLRVN